MSDLDDLLRLAAEAEPDPLPDEAVERALRAAAVEGRARFEAGLAPSERDGETDALDALARLAGDAEPDPLHPVEVDRAVNRAAAAGRARHRSFVLRRVTGVAAVSAAIAAAAATVLMLQAPEPAPTDGVAEAGPAAGRTTGPETAPAPETTPDSDRARADRADRPGNAVSPVSPTRLELETGDRLLATEQARFTVERATRLERVIELGSGSMLFDVQPLDGGTFTVVTADARVTVLGTVFTVQASPHGTTVRVYEGRVRVERLDAPRRDEARVITPGDTARIGEGDADDPLAEPARRAAERRTSAATAQADVLAAAPAARVSEPGRRSRPRPTQTPEAPPAPAAPRDDEHSSAADLRGLIAAGEADRALAIAQTHTAAGELDPWLMLEADALRALHRVEDAAAAYQRAAERFGAPRRQQAGYLAARLLAPRAPADALAQLDAAGVTEPGSPLRERGLALQVDMLSRLGRPAELRSAAATYLSLYPDGSRAARMRELAPEADP